MAVQNNSLIIFYLLSFSVPYPLSLSSSPPLSLSHNLHHFLFCLLFIYLVLFHLFFSFLAFSGVPAFDPLLESQTVVAGSTVTFQCSAIGDPPPSITWSHNNEILSVGGKISFTESQLIITNVQEENDGFYECSASNIFGSNITSAKLSVNSEWFEVHYS